MNRVIILGVIVMLLSGLRTNGQNIPMIRDGRVWEYGGGYREPDERGQVFHYMKFQEQVTVNGKTYTGFGVFNSKYYRYENEENSYNLSKDVDRDGPVWLLREEEGKVYILYSGKDVSPDSSLKGFTVETSWPLAENLETSDSAEYGECLLYDFSLAAGDIIRLPTWSEVFQHQNSYGFEVSYGEKILIDEEECRVQYLNIPDDSVSVEDGPKYSMPVDSGSFQYITEGIGIMYNGCLPYYSLLLSSGQDYNNYYCPGPESYLRSIMDGEGKVLYGADSPASLSMIQTDQNINKITYDVLGRRVRSTVSGGVYIRGGKKFVAR